MYVGTDKVKDAKAIANKAKVPGMISIVDINVTADTSKLKSYIKESDLCIRCVYAHLAAACSARSVY